jgi:hypothetical protein
VSGRSKAAFLLDRTAVLFIGLLFGSIISYAFFAGAAPSEPTLVTPATASANPAGTSLVPVPADTSPIVTPRLAAAAAEGRKVHIGVFGDSFGDGIYSALYQQMRGRENVEVHKFSHQATGFTRYRTTNLLDDTRRRIDAQPIDVAVLSFGANDMQGVYVDGRGSEFMSDRWKEIVAARVTEVVQLLRARGAAVFWVGLPKMREADYDRNVQQMNAFYTQTMARLGVPFVDTVSATVDSGGAYAPYLTDEAGERFNARANDGIHMTFRGYSRLTRNLADRITRSIGAGQATQQASATGGSRG